MKKVLTFLMLASCFLMLNACITAPTAGTTETEVIINSSFDKVWNATISYLVHDGGYQILTQDKASGLIRVTYHYGGPNVYDKAKARVVSMPAILFASWVDFGGEFQILISAKTPSASSVYIRTVDMFVYRAPIGNELMPKSFKVSSNGVMENEIVSSVKQQLGLPVDVSTATGTTAK